MLDCIKISMGNIICSGLTILALTLGCHKSRRVIDIVVTSKINIILPFDRKRFTEARMEGNVLIFFFVIILL